MCKDLKLENISSSQRYKNVLLYHGDRELLTLWLLSEGHLQAFSLAGVAALGLISLYWLLCRLLALKPSHASHVGLALTLQRLSQINQMIKQHLLPTVCEDFGYSSVYIISFVTDMLGRVESTQNWSQTTENKSSLFHNLGV